MAVLVGARKRLRRVSPSRVESFVLGHQLSDHLSSWRRALPRALLLRLTALFYQLQDFALDDDFPQPFHVVGLLLHHWLGTSHVGTHDVGGYRVVVVVLQVLFFLHDVEYITAALLFGEAVQRQKLARAKLEYGHVVETVFNEVHSAVSVSFCVVIVVKVGAGLRQILDQSPDPLVRYLVVA